MTGLLKNLITATEIKKAAANCEGTLNILPESIITPAAKDVAKELGIQLIVGSAQFNEIKKPGGAVSVEMVRSDLDPNLVAKIVGEVMACLNLTKQHTKLHKEVDPSGLRLVSGDSVELEDFDTGNPKEKIKIKELLNSKESPNLSAGFMTLESTSYATHIKHEELNYIIDGSVECTVNSKTYMAKPGDILYIPADTQITFAASHYVKLFYVSS